MKKVYGVVLLLRVSMLWGMDGDERLSYVMRQASRSRVTTITQATREFTDGVKNYQFQEEDVMLALEIYNTWCSRIQNLEFIDSLETWREQHLKLIVAMRDYHPRCRHLRDTRIIHQEMVLTFVKWKVLFDAYDWHPWLYHEAAHWNKYRVSGQNFNYDEQPFSIKILMLLLYLPNKIKMGVQESIEYSVERISNVTRPMRRTIISSITRAIERGTRDFEEHCRNIARNVRSRGRVAPE